MPKGVASFFRESGLLNQVQVVSARQAAEDLYRTESRRIFASLVRLVGDFDQAEEAMHEAFAAAFAQWPRDGVPANPRAWLVSAGRFKAIDAIRRRARFDNAIAEVAQRVHPEQEPQDWDDAQFKDDQLRLIFTCCHPALPPASQVALTLREVCGLTTEEIASAFLTSPPTMAQRIVRGKAKIRNAGIPFTKPSLADLPDRVDAVLSVIYLIFNEGYSASSGDSITRADLSGEAIRLGRVLLDLLPEPEVMGLLALMLLHESRRTARATQDGDIILLEDQDRTLWDRTLIAEGVSLVGRAFQGGEVGAYTIQAAIAAQHAVAAQPDQTNWAEIVALYDLLFRASPSPIVELNRAVAVAMRDGPEPGLRLIDDLLARGNLADYRLAHSARAELCRRMGRKEEARKAYERALELTRQEPERRFMEKRLQELA